MGWDYSVSIKTMDKESGKLIDCAGGNVIFDYSKPVGVVNFFEKYGTCHYEDSNIEDFSNSLCPHCGKTYNEKIRKDIEGFNKRENKVKYYTIPIQTFVELNKINLKYEPKNKPIQLGIDYEYMIEDDAFTVEIFGLYPDYEYRSENYALNLLCAQVHIFLYERSMQLKIVKDFWMPQIHKKLEESTCDGCCKDNRTLLKEYEREINVKDEDLILYCWQSY
jgi:hypothetical protein